jgi:hypothetical protein
MAARRIARAGFGIILVVVIAACSGAAATTVSPTGLVTPAGPSSSPVETATPTESTAPTDSAAPTASPEPSASHKPLPSIDQAQLDAYLTSSITLIDLADDDLSVTVSYADPSSNESIDFGTYALASTEQMTNQVPPGTYRLEFHQPAKSTTKQTCTIEVSDSDAYTFAAVKGAVAISRTGTKPKNVRDLFVSTSSLCGN